MFGKLLIGMFVMLLIALTFWGGIFYLGSVVWDHKTEISKNIGEGVHDIIDGAKEGFNKE